MQFETRIRCRLPRADCPEHGVKTIHVPWADPSSRYTRLFEQFAIEVLLASRTVTQATELLRLGWDAAQRIMERAVERGMDRRQLDHIDHVGLDEKSFSRGQSYVSILTDIDRSRVLEVTHGRDRQAADFLWETLSEEQREQIEAVAIDMSEYYVASAKEAAPNAAIVHDKFHIAKYLNDAVAKVHRQENKVLQKQGDETLKGSRQLWLFNPENMTEHQKEVFEGLRGRTLKVSRAWAIKELFSEFWTYRSRWAARRFFKRWFGWASRSRLKPIIAVARMLKRHFENIITYLNHPITNSLAEGFNSKIQTIKSNARGFRSFWNYRIRILFFCGDLNLVPQ